MAVLMRYTLRSMPIIASACIWIAVATPAGAQQVCSSSDFYLANPNAVSAQVQSLLDYRQELVRQAQILQRAGLGHQYTNVRETIRQHDLKIQTAIRHQAEQEMLLARDPRRLSFLVSQSSGMDIKILPRIDCRYNVEIQGVVRYEGLSEREVVSTLKTIN